uniref:COP9 signalosome complex subunit 9 n=1 Tax=Oryzias sinensis TaxID=183150 RepID=A0A8C7Y4H2_9TELE
MKPAVDEMFPEGAGPYVDLDEAGGSSGLLMDLAANEKAVHSDFFNGKAQISVESSSTVQHLKHSALLLQKEYSPFFGEAIFFSFFKKSCHFSKHLPQYHISEDL